MDDSTAHNTLTELASVTAPDTSQRRAMSADDIAFMSRVVPWPADDDPGYINVHWTIPQEGAKPWWPGKPTRSLSEFQNIVQWVLSRPTTSDIYFCLSRQRERKENGRGGFTAIRNQRNAIAVKALWLDIDVKQPPEGYATALDAWAALKDFYAAVDLPAPSALVASGGGLHAYWISKTPLTPEKWRPLAVGLKNAAVAQGLRCDVCCTVDIARILRVPGTWNCKNGLMRPVELLWLGEMYDL